jgi:hypothetical protein
MIPRCFSRELCLTVGVLLGFFAGIAVSAYVWVVFK